MAMAGEIFERQLSALERVPAVMQRKIGDAGIGAIEEHWPSPAWGAETHPFSTGFSIDRWEWIAGQGASITIQCPADYSGYTERGYNRNGPGAAFSWGVRRFGRYSLNALIGANLDQIVADVISEALSGD